MFQTFLHSLVESNVLWLIWAALGVLILSLCMVLASVMMRESDEPLRRFAASRTQESADDGKMIV